MNQKTTGKTYLDGLPTEALRIWHIIWRAGGLSCVAASAKKGRDRWNLAFMEGGRPRPPESRRRGYDQR